MSDSPSFQSAAICNAQPVAVVLCRPDSVRQGGGGYPAGGPAEVAALSEGAAAVERSRPPRPPAQVSAQVPVSYSYCHPRDGARAVSDFPVLQSRLYEKHGEAAVRSFSQFYPTVTPADVMAMAQKSHFLAYLDNLVQSQTEEHRYAFYSPSMSR